MIESRFTSFGEKLDTMTMRIDTIEANMTSLNSSSTGIQFEKPSAIPFKTHADILKYNDSTPEQREQMRNYLLFFHMHNNAKCNMRSILQNKRLMTDELLADMVWKGKKGQKTSKLILYKKCITHDLRTVMKQMYPDITYDEFQAAVTMALNAANARVYAKNKKIISNRKRSGKGAKAVNAKKAKVTDEQLFENEWSHENDNDEETSDEDEDDANNDRDDNEIGEEDNVTLQSQILV